MCAGGCETFQTSFVRINGMKIGNKECKCCSAYETHIDEITMICDSKLITAEYIRIDSCKCNACDSNNNGDDSFTNDISVN